MALEEMEVDHLIKRAPCCQMVFFRETMNGNNEIDEWIRRDQFAVVLFHEPDDSCCRIFLSQISCNRFTCDDVAEMFYQRNRSETCTGMVAARPTKVPLYDQKMYRDIQIHAALMSDLSH